MELLLRRLQLTGELSIQVTLQVDVADKSGLCTRRRGRRRFRARSFRPHRLHLAAPFLEFDASRLERIQCALV